MARPAPGTRLADRFNALIAGAGHRLLRLARPVLEIAEKRRQRRALSRLDARLLRDIGVSREQAAREARRIF